MNGRRQTAWLLITVSTAGAPATLRVTVWRRLKELGALGLQQSVWLLPARTATTQAVTQLGDRITRDGGTIRVLRITFSDTTDEAALINELSAARNGEYAEALERFPAFFDELRSETMRGRATFEEVQESEADLTRFRTWLRKIAARDYFQAQLGPQARAELERAEDALTAFVELAIAAEAPPEADDRSR